MPKLTRSTLPDIAAALSQSISASLLDRAQLASDARNAGISDYAAIIGAAFRRSESTVSHWARTWSWIRLASDARLDWVGTRQLPYSFFETCARYSDRIETPVLCELLLAYHENAGATLESFRAELAVMAGADSVADFSKFVGKTRRDILSHVDQAPTRRGGEFLKAAADALADAMAEMEERVTA